MGIRAAVLLLFAALLAGAPCGSTRAAETPLEDTLYLDLDFGRVVIHMRPDLAPKHVARIKQLVRGGFYDGMVFHRVIDGFMAQTGDPKADGTGGTGRMLEGEFTRTPQVRGTVSMARAAAKNSADSQWFIVLTDNNRSSLDGQYTVWGEVTSGMEFVDKIKKGNVNKNGAVANPDKIARLQVAADAERKAPEKLANADLLKLPGAALTAHNFSGEEFRCSALVNGVGVEPQTALASLWAQGFLAGTYKAQGMLAYAADGDGGFDATLLGVCTTYPTAFLIAATSQGIGKTARELPAATAAFSPASYTCKAYTAARGTAEADFAELWSFAFIEGYKAVNQPTLEIPFDTKAQLVGAVANTCAKNPDAVFADLTALVAEKVKLK